MRIGEVIAAAGRQFAVGRKDNAIDGPLVPLKHQPRQA